jgi:hypothetical protein
MTIRLGVMIVISFCCFLTSLLPASAAVISDNFNNCTINNLLWQPETMGSGVTATQRNGRLEISMSRHAQDDPNRGIFRAGYISTGRFSGDFDIQVDFYLIDWPAANGVRVGLVTENGTVDRTSRGNETSSTPSHQEYVTNIGTAIDPVLFWMHNPTQSKPAEARSGKLRLVRHGTRATGYFFHDGEWQEIGSNTVTYRDVRFGLLAWSHNSVFTNKPVSVAFDNFTINSGRLVLLSNLQTAPRL